LPRRVPRPAPVIWPRQADFRPALASRMAVVTAFSSARTLAFIRVTRSGLKPAPRRRGRTDRVNGIRGAVPCRKYARDVPPEILEAAPHERQQGWSDPLQGAQTGLRKLPPESAMLPYPTCQESAPSDAIHRTANDATAWIQRCNRAIPARSNRPEPPQTGKVGARASPHISGTGNQLALDACQNAWIADFFNSISALRPPHERSRCNERRLLVRESCAVAPVRGGPAAMGRSQPIPVLCHKPP
jgi:hypothetical protein